MVFNTAPDMKLAHSLAKQITRYIVAGGFSADQLLGREADLRARYSVSRDTFREALRQLEWLGITRSQRGINGGIYVQAPKQSLVVNLLRDYFDFSQADFSDLLKVRAVLEQDLVRVALQKLDDRDIVKLRILQGQYQHGMTREQFVVLLFGFYRQLMDIANNDVVNLCLMPLIFVTVDLVNFEKLSDEEFALNSALAWSKLSLLLNEIIAGNSAIASTHLQGFLDFTAESVASQIATLHSVSAYPDWFDDSHSKLAEGLIYRIHRDIRDTGCENGERLGTETELMNRYAVSRSTFREACRVLETVGLVYMQKGRDGGLRVGQPKPDNAISAVVYYLNATAAPYADIAAVRAAVELAAIPLAAEMLTEDDAKSLSVLIETQQALVGEASFTSAAMATQKAINHLGGNTILNFYYDALLDSIYLTEQGKQALAKLAKYAEPITASQSAIVDAVLHRDPALARRRVLQHHNIIEKYIAGV